MDLCKFTRKHLTAFKSVGWVRVYASSRIKMSLLFEKPDGLDCEGPAGVAGGAPRGRENGAK